MGNIVWSVIISSYNSSERIYEVINKLNECSLQTSTLGEIVIVDDNSTTILEQNKIAQSNITINIIRNHENLGQSKSENIGANHAKGSIIFFLNDDCVPADKLFIKSTIDLYSKNNLVIAGYLTTIADSNSFERMRFPTKIRRINRVIRYGDLQGGCFAIDKNLFKLIGGFSEDLKYFQDIDLSYKLSSNNIAILLNKHMWAEHLDVTISLEKELIKTYRAYKASFRDIAKKFPLKIHEFYWGEIFTRREQWIEKLTYSTSVFILIYYIYKILYLIIPHRISIEIYNFLQRCVIFYAIRNKKVENVWNLLT